MIAQGNAAHVSDYMQITDTGSYMSYITVISHVSIIGIQVSNQFFSGIGIAKADQDKLFKSFSQVDASISRT